MSQKAAPKQWSNLAYIVSHLSPVADGQVNFFDYHAIF